MRTVANLSPTTDSDDARNAYWRGYADALREFPRGVGELSEAAEPVFLDFVSRIEGRPAPTRPPLRVIRGGAA